MTLTAFYWNPESTIIISALNMDKTNILYLPHDLTKHPVATSEQAKYLIEDSITNPEKLLETYSFALDFNALVANNPRRHAALCAYSNNCPCSYSDALQKQTRHAEVLWYDNHPEVPPSFSHCFLTIGESDLLHDRVLRESSLTYKDIYIVRTEHAHAMKNSWPAKFHSDDSTRDSDTTIAPQTEPTFQRSKIYCVYLFEFQFHR